MDFKKLLFAAAIALLELLPGCTGSLKRVAADTTPTVVESGIDTISEPGNQEKIGEIIGNAVASADDEVVDSVLARLADPSNAKHLRKITDTISSQLVTDLGVPASPLLQRQRDALITQTTQLAVRAAVHELKSSLPELIAAVLTNTQVKEALVPLSRSAGQQATKGVGDTITGQAPEDH